MEVKYFGQYLIERKSITQKQLLSAIQLQERTNLPLGVLAIKLGYLSQENLRKIERYQLEHNLNFIGSCVKLKYLEQEKIDHLVERQLSNNLLLGEALVRQKSLTRDQLEELFKDFRGEQSELEFDILHHITSHKESDLIGASLQSFINLFRYLFGMAGRITGVEENGKPSKEMRWVSYQKVFGDKDLTLCVFLNDHLLMQIASKMLKREINQINELSQDSAKEFTNILVGYLCTYLSVKNLQCKTDIPQIKPVEQFNLNGSTNLKIPVLLPQGIPEIHLILGKFNP